MSDFHYNCSVRVLTYMPKLHIHVWGGLGSQLNAWALYIDLKERLPHRRIQLVLHNGGVTKREPELYFIDELPEIKLIEDYRDSSLLSKDNLKFNYQTRFKTFLASIVKVVLKKSGIIATCNNDHDFKAIKPWVWQIRGHYSNKAISNMTLSKLKKEMNQKIDLPSHKYSTGVGLHFRLGDLVDLQSKSPISINHIFAGIDKANSTKSLRHIYVASDSIALALQLLSKLKDTGFNLEALESSTWEVIYIMSTTKVFVGSSSKVSEWIALLRVYSDKADSTYLPLNMKSQMDSIGARLGEINMIGYF